MTDWAGGEYIDGKRPQFGGSQQKLKGWSHWVQDGEMFLEDLILSTELQMKTLEVGELDGK